MKKILITGGLGQVGTEFALKLREELGNDNVIVTDIEKKEGLEYITEAGPFYKLDVTDIDNYSKIVIDNKVDTIINLAALLSATGEKNPQLCWNINMNGLYNTLEIARDKDILVFTPSSIAAFGDSTPKDKTPQDTIQRPDTMYGVTKVAGELLADYYFKKFGVDTRGVRYPGLISYKTLPGGGTTDYAVEIYYKAIEEGRYTSFIAEGTKMDMMYMEDAINSSIKLMKADPDKLIHRNAFNVTAFSIEPEEVANSIKKFIPEFKMDYDVDPVRQKIAESWPNSLDASAAIEEWNFKPEYDLDKMSEDMIKNLKIKLKK